MKSMYPARMGLWHPNPCVCPYCKGYKSYSAKHCIRCQVIAIENYRQAQWEAELSRFGGKRLA